MTSYVLDKVEFMKPTFSYSTEYDTKYNRQLWDKATRSHYFQLSKDRRRRMLQAAKHAPIHWDIGKDEDIESISSGCLRQNQRSPQELIDRNVGATCPEPPKRIKSAWCEQTPRSQSPASEFVVLDKSDADSVKGRDSSLGIKRSNDQRSPTPSSVYGDDRKRLRTPGSNCEAAPRTSPICRPKSAPSSRLSVHKAKDYSRPPSQSSKIRPSTGSSRPSTATSRPSTGGSRPGTGNTIRSSLSSKYTKLPSPSGQTRANVNKCKKDSTKKQASAPYALYGGESETARGHELRDHRVKNAAKGLRIGFQKVGSNKLRDQYVDMTELPRDIRLWVTEYQGNFKAFNPI